LDGRSINPGVGLQTHGINYKGQFAQIVGNRVLNYVGYGILGGSVGGRAVANAYIADNYIYSVMAAFQVGDNTIVERNEVERINIHGTNEPEGDFMRVFGSNIIVRNNYLHGTTLADLY